MSCKCAARAASLVPSCKSARFELRSPQGCSKDLVGLESWSLAKRKRSKFNPAGLVMLRLGATRRQTDNTSSAKDIQEWGSSKKVLCLRLPFIQTRVASQWIHRHAFTFTFGDCLSWRMHFGHCRPLTHVHCTTHRRLCRVQRITQVHNRSTKSLLKTKD